MPANPNVASAFPVTTIVIDAALDLLHTLCCDGVCSCGALCDNGILEPCGNRGLMIYERFRDRSRLTRASGEVRAGSPRRWLGLNKRIHRPPASCPSQEHGLQVLVHKFFRLTASRRRRGTHAGFAYAYGSPLNDLCQHDSDQVLNHELNTKWLNRN